MNNITVRVVNKLILNMEDKAVIKALTTSDYKGVIYQMGKEYTVLLSIARALGSSVSILQIDRVNVPTTNEIKESLEKKTNPVKAKKKMYRAPKNAAILNDDKSVVNK